MFSVDGGSLLWYFLSGAIGFVAGLTAFYPRIRKLEKEVKLAEDGMKKLEVMATELVERLRSSGIKMGFFLGKTD
jgi:hypothetical protein